MVLLILSEYKSFLEVKTSSEMFIDINRGGDKVKINIFLLIIWTYMIIFHFKIITKKISTRINFFILNNSCI